MILINKMLEDESIYNLYYFFPVQTKYVTTGLGLIVNLFLFRSYHPRDSFQQFFSEVIHETSPKTNAPTNTPSQRSVSIHEQLP